MFYFLFLVLFIGFGLLAQDIPEQKILVLYNEQPQQESNTGLERQRYQETMKLEVAVITRCWLKKKKKNNNEKKTPQVLSQFLWWVWVLSEVWLSTGTAYGSEDWQDM